MSATYRWSCVCGATGTGEIPAQEHARACHRFGWPWTNPEYPKPEEGAE